MAKVPATTRSAIGIGEKFVGRIVHYYPRINVGIVEVTDDDINLGDVIRNSFANASPLEIAQNITEKTSVLA